MTLFWIVVGWVNWFRLVGLGILLWFGLGFGFPFDFRGWFGDDLFLFWLFGVVGWVLLTL